MISNRRSQRLFSSLRIPHSQPKTDPMVASYDDVYGFSDEEEGKNGAAISNGTPNGPVSSNGTFNGAATSNGIDSKKNGVRKSLQYFQGTSKEGNGTTRNGHVEFDQRKSMRSSNGVIVTPHTDHDSTTAQAKLKLKTRSTSVSIPRHQTLGDELSKIMEERQRKLVAVVPPKPPQTFSTFQHTLPKSKPAITAPKQSLQSVPVSSSVKSTTGSDQINGDHHADYGIINGNDQSTGILGKVKAMKEAFNTNIDSIPPPVPAKKDYKPEQFSFPLQTGNSNNRRSHTDQKHCVVTDHTSGKNERTSPRGTLGSQPMPGSQSIRQQAINPKNETQSCGNGQNGKTGLVRQIISELKSMKPSSSSSAPSTSTPASSSLSSSSLAPSQSQSQPKPLPTPGRVHKPISNSRSLELNQGMTTSCTERNRFSEGNIGKTRRSHVDERLLNDFVWFHGDINRSDAEQRLVEFSTDGGFLVRYKSIPSKESPYSLSVLQNGKVYHLQIRQKSNRTYALGDQKQDELEFGDLHEIVSYHRRQPLHLIRRKSGELASLALLTSALPRDTRYGQ